MPELPEVETIRLALLDKILCCQLTAFTLGHYPHAALTLEPVIGKTIRQIVRRGKYLIFDLGSLFMIFHLRMSGRVMLKKAQDPTSGHLKVQFFLNNGMRIDFEDVRKFGTIDITTCLQSLEQKLGVEPIGGYFMISHLDKLIQLKPQMALKTFLLDQSFIAGIGNIYADEICHQAGISPFRKLAELDQQMIEKLYQAIIAVLKRAVSFQGTSLGVGLTNFKTPHAAHGQNQHHLFIYGRQGLPCYRCGQLIQKERFQSRGTHFCSCQN